MKTEKRWFSIAFVLILCSVFIATTNGYAQKECVRQYKVTILQVENVPAGCTGTVYITVNGVKYSTPFVPGQSNYYFDEINSYPQIVCPGYSLNCGITSPVPITCSNIATRFPCGTYTLYSLQIGDIR